MPDDGQSGHAPDRPQSAQAWMACAEQFRAIRVAELDGLRSGN
jgi:hypothetical protein